MSAITLTSSDGVDISVGKHDLATGCCREWHWQIPNRAHHCWALRPDQEYAWGPWRLWRGHSHPQRECLYRGSQHPEPDAYISLSRLTRPSSRRSLSGANTTRATPPAPTMTMTTVARLPTLMSGTRSLCRSTRRCSSRSSSYVSFSDLLFGAHIDFS